MKSRPYFGGKSSPILPLVQSLSLQADSIDICVSFLKISGISLILPALRAADQAGRKIRLLCGTYMGITEPTALLILRKELSPRAELRLFASQEISFHPKCWMFHLPNRTQILIGSSNVSRSALTSGIEWNYTFSSEDDPDSVSQIERSFEDLWEKESLLLDEKQIAEYARHWTKPKAAGIPAPSLPVPAFDLDQTPPCDQRPAFTPNPVQIEALYALEDVRKKGIDRALIQAATGTGKTVLAALDSRSFHRILFVAHREELLQQAAETFERIRPASSIGFFKGNEHITDCEITLASVSTLGKSSYLNPSYFSPDAFDYIVIDEVHHAAAAQYQKILSYFHPRFLLGITATPYRLDGRDIFALFNYVVPYRIDLFQAVSRGFLAPFHYYGIYDETDYSHVAFRNGHYSIADLDKLYLQEDARALSILKHYRKHPSRHALGFCSSIVHAQYMARFFNEHGIPAAAVTSSPDREALSRKEAIADLRRSKLKILFCVDIFNEGTDIPEVDLLLFLRPTESAVIFLQQLGRGLRLSPEKSYLTVLDFIGNSRSASLGPSLLLQQDGHSITDHGTIRDDRLPPDCFADFDLRLIDLFDEMNRRFERTDHQIIALFRQTKLELGHVPSRLEMYNALDNEQIALFYKNARINPFRNYLSFLTKMTALPDGLTNLSHLNPDAAAFLNVLETTSMSRVYKMPLLLSFIDENGKLRESVSEEQALASWKFFFSQGMRWKDLGVSSKESFELIPDSVHLRSIRSNPVRALLKSGKGFFVLPKQGLLAFKPDLFPFLKKDWFVEQYRDIVELRITHYFHSRYEKEELQDLL